MMKKIAIAIATERSDLPPLVSAAIRAANSQNVSDVERCFDVLRYMKSLNLSVNDLCHSKVILPLESLRDHENPKIRMEANLKKKEDERSQAHEATEVKQIGDCKCFAARTIQKTKLSALPMKFSENPNNCLALKKNSTEMLELFEIAKKSVQLPLNFHYSKANNVVRVVNIYYKDFHNLSLLFQVRYVSIFLFT
ncbi:unnamed protein product [Arabidopsis lyrata]|nr:unnamed protein product [Arabidopsis lyrata]